MRHICITELIANRKLICYGAGLSLAGLLDVVALPIAYVVDDTPGLLGTSIGGHEIRASSSLDHEDKSRIFVLICAHTPKATATIARNLCAKGLRYGIDYADCAFLHFETIGKRLLEKFGIKPSYEKFAKCRFLSMNSPGENLSTIGGSWLFVEMVDWLGRQLGGDVAEFGVYKGGNAFVSLLASDILQSRPYHLLDSFQGFPELSQEDPASRSTEFRDSNAEEVRRMFQDFDQVRIHEGFFDQILPRLGDRTFCISYIDCDLYEPTKLCLAFLQERIPKGGCIIFHDYWMPGGETSAAGRECWAGISRAVKECGFISPESLIVFPETTHAIFIRN